MANFEATLLASNSTSENDLAVITTVDWYLELTGSILFGIVAVLATRALFSTYSNTQPQSQHANAMPPGEGMRMRRMLMRGLLGASATRCLTLAAELVLNSDLARSLIFSLQDSQIQWLNDLLLMMPPVIFLSALSVVVLFLSQVHYTNMMTPLPVLGRLFLGLNAGCYITAAVIAVFSYLLQAYDIFRVFMICTIGLVSLFISFSIFYYGFFVWSWLSERARKNPASKVVSRAASRCLVLTIVCPLALLGQGSAYLVWAVEAGNRVDALPLWENISVSLLAEWLSSVIVLLTLQAFQQGPSDGIQMNSQDSVGSLGDSSDSEAPLLATPVTPPGNLGGPEGGTWKQIYPQPAS